MACHDDISLLLAINNNPQTSLFPFQLFRLEHEHLNNTFNYRKVSFVPLHFSTEIKEKEIKPTKGLRTLTEVLGMAGVVVAVTIVSIILAKTSNADESILPSQS